MSAETLHEPDQAVTQGLVRRVDAERAGEPAGETHPRDVHAEGEPNTFTLHL